jgi:putative nucleotide binding protein
MMIKKDLKKDEKAVVLDFLTHGHYDMKISQPVAQVVGEEYFSLLEVIVRDGVHLKVGQRVYIGDGKRDEVKFIKRRMEFNDLTGAAKEELEDIIKEIVDEKPDRFLSFFNSAGPITTRLHQLELLPGIGKKHLWAIISERKEKTFESFSDLKKRVAMLPDPEKMIIRRIMEEMEDSDKYRIFVPRFEKLHEHEGRY